MDSQEQYEALLKRWGLEDRSAERRARRELWLRRAKFAVAYAKKALTPVRKSTAHKPATL
ncbi:hypothetical protein [Marinomonas pollencensis]|uniref:Uncharacterized protein n=1 Tax=Marinomonas pollencensis TaxID=491954 RepID=A0A3E0DS29_9GAMM|nr:hypothetical protein [Marinomonas pollencensis]REG85878.1 hypothetical protein DFP81_102417 [Marinomonas pollencensis]